MANKTGNKQEAAPAVEQETKKDAERMTQENYMNAEILAQQKKEIERLKRENEELRKNSIQAGSPFGGAGDYERVKKACERAAEEGKNPWDVTISVQAPRRGKGEDSYWLSVNGRTMQVPANERYYELSLPFAQCLVDAIRSERNANDFMDKIEVYDPVTNPKKENVKQA